MRRLAIRQVVLAFAVLVAAAAFGWAEARRPTFLPPDDDITKDSGTGAYVNGSMLSYTPHNTHIAVAYKHGDKTSGMAGAKRECAVRASFRKKLGTDDYAVECPMLPIENQKDHAHSGANREIKMHKVYDQNDEGFIDMSITRVDGDKFWWSVTKRFLKVQGGGNPDPPTLVVNPPTAGTTTTVTGTFDPSEGVTLTARLSCGLGVGLAPSSSSTSGSTFTFVFGASTAGRCMVCVTATRPNGEFTMICVPVQAP